MSILKLIANLFSKIMFEYMPYPFVKKNLLYNCIKLYNDIETFDNVSDKFTPRANIGYIITHTCTLNRDYYNYLVSIASDKQNDFMFKRFINMSLDDLTLYVRHGFVY